MSNQFDFEGICTTLEAFFANDGMATVGNYHQRREYKSLTHELRISYDAAADKLLIEQCTLGHQPRSMRQTFFVMMRPCSKNNDEQLVGVLVAAGIITSESLIQVYKDTVQPKTVKQQEVAA